MPTRYGRVRNWTDTQQITPGKASPQFRNKQLNLDDGHFVCLYSGTMSNKQGLDLVVDAARALDQAGSNIRFVLCGEGPHKGKLQQLATGLSNLQFLGLQSAENFAELLKAADVHLIPQRAEAADLVLPSKLGGILASGKPVIVMAKPGTGLADEVENAGLVIPAGDAAQLAGAVSTLAMDAELCSSFGKSARATALARWDKTTILVALEQMLRAARAPKEMVPTSFSSSPAEPRSGRL